MVSSVREFHSSDELSIYLLIIDWDGLSEIDLKGLDLNIFAGRFIGMDDFDYLALKFSAAELSMSSKPWFINYVLSLTNHKKIIYVDADVYVFARLEHILACMENAWLVVTPHISEPYLFR
jgi:hypothetical protein